MKIISLLIVGSITVNALVSLPHERTGTKKDVSQKVDSVMRLMTLEEKIGQMNQYSANFHLTGPANGDTTIIQQIREGKVGSMLNVIGAAETRAVQKAAMQSRLHIPLIFGLDVIHGLRTIYPIPLGESASFDLDLMRRSARAAAIEATSLGIHWTFAPMVDIARDARWGRVMEGAGEDTWYGCKVAEERVKGFQGHSLYDKNTIMACAKHFAAYGACIGGRDYNSVDMSDVLLDNVYLPPFKAALRSGVATFMNSFNDINGLPSTANSYLQRTLLKGDWHFNGFVVSDWNSVGEMVNHGFVADLKGAAQKGIEGGCDMDMESRAYIKNLEILIKEKKIDISLINDAVRRILTKKFELGLFEDPYRYCDTEREKSTVLCDELRAVSREAGEKSIVLLKNDSNALPLINPSHIALVGPLCQSKADMLGGWAADGDKNAVVTVLEGLKQRYPKSNITYAEGYDIETNALHADKALAAAKDADVVVVAVGERASQSGEARSMAHIDVPHKQQELVRLLKQTGKKVIVLVMGGRPLVFDKLTPYSDAILMTWWLGTEAGNAIADVLSGDYNPSGKLPMTFPATIGQVPIYYNYKSTGRPAYPGTLTYSTGYMDQDYRPAYPFGYGLSYTKFELSEPRINASVYQKGEPIVCKVTVRNIGRLTGKETVQLYIRDKVASLTRPVKELRGFQQTELKPGESKELTFTLHDDDLGFYNARHQFVVEPGEFLIMTGNSSGDVKTASFLLK